MTKSVNRSRNKRHNRQEKSKSNIFFNLKAFATLYTAGVGIIAEDKSLLREFFQNLGAAIVFLFRF